MAPRRDRVHGAMEECADIQRRKIELLRRYLPRRPTPRLRLSTCSPSSERKLNSPRSSRTTGTTPPKNGPFTRPSVKRSTMETAPLDISPLQAGAHRPRRRRRRHSRCFTACTSSSVLGFILVGVVVGPFGLGSLTPLICLGSASDHHQYAGRTIEAIAGSVSCSCCS